MWGDYLVEAGGVGPEGIHLRQNTGGGSLLNLLQGRGGGGRTAEERRSAMRQWVGTVFKGGKWGCHSKYSAPGKRRATWTQGIRKLFSVQRCRPSRVASKGWALSPASGLLLWVRLQGLKEKQKWGGDTYRLCSAGSWRMREASKIAEAKRTRGEYEFCSEELGRLGQDRRGALSGRPWKGYWKMLTKSSTK